MSGGSWLTPSTWEWVPIGAVCSVVGGGTPSTKSEGNFCPPGEGVAWITPADLSNYRSTTIKRGARDITAKGLLRSGAQVMPSRSVLFSSRAPIGYVAITEGPVCTNQGFKSFVPPRGLCPEYLYYYLLRARQVAMNLASGTTFKELSGANAAVIPLPVPPTGEQMRIVASLEALLSRLDAAVASLERAQAKLKAYRASVLKAAVEGRLVPTEAELARRENREYEPAQVLLDRILEERRRRWEDDERTQVGQAGRRLREGRRQAKYQPPIPPGAGDEYLVAPGWCIASADQLTARITDGEHITPPRTSAGVLLLSARNVCDGYLDLAAVDHVSEETHGVLTKRLEVREGDVLLSCSGSVGRSCVVPPRIRFSLVRSVAVLKPIGVDPNFLSMALRSHLLKKQVDQRKSQTAQANIFQSSIKRLVFPLPPREEQERIVAVAGELLSEGDRMAAATTLTAGRCARLRQSILKWAFEGKLVDQDPNDEPADVLLARIRAERAAAAATKAPAKAPAEKPRGKKAKPA